MSGRLHTRAAHAAATCVLAVFALTLGVLPHTAGADQTGELQNQIQSSKAKEQSLKSAASQLGALAAKASSQVNLLENRVSAAQGAVSQAQAAVVSTEASLVKAKARQKRLHKRLREVRVRLGAVLRARYTGERPDLMTVLLQAKGFATLLDTVDDLKRVEKTDAGVLTEVRAARVEANREAKTLATLAVKQRAEAAAVTTQRDSLVGIQSGLQARQATLDTAHAARLAALSQTASVRQHAEQELQSLLAAQRTLSTTTSGGGGSWAIPWAIVQCESGGQNVPSNGGPSGYYQIQPATWKGLGGSTDQAYEASKAEQDSIAAKLWAGGAGRGNWSCSSLAA